MINASVRQRRRRERQTAMGPIGVAGWDEHGIFTQRIRNYTRKTIEVEVRRSYSGHVFFRSKLPKIKLHDYRTVQFTTQVHPGEKKDHPFELVTRNGYRKKQNNVTLEQSDVEL